MEDIQENEVLEAKEKTKKGNKKIVIIALAIILIGLVLVFTFSSYKLLFSPKKLKLLSFVNDDFNEIKSIALNISDNSLIKLFKHGNKSLDFDFSLDSKELSGSAYINTNFFGLKLNDITENYLILENSNLTDFWEKIGMAEYDLPDEINFKNNKLNITKFDSKRINNFLTKCAYNILENLENKNFIQNEQKSIEIQGKDEQYKTIEVQLSQNDLLMLEKEVLLAFEKEGILNLVVDKVNSISNSEALNKSELKKDLEKQIAYIDLAKAYNELSEEEANYYIIYRIYYDENNNIIARTLTEKYNYSGQEYEDIIISLVTKNDNFYEAKLFNQDENHSGAYYNIISDEISENEGIKNHDITYSIEGFYVKNSDDGEDYEYVPLNSSVNYNLQIENLDNNLTIIKLNDESDNYKFSLEYDENHADVEFKNAEINAKINISNNDTTKTKLIDNGAILLNSETQEEIMNQFNQISGKVLEMFQ